MTKPGNGEIFDANPTHDSQKEMYGSGHCSLVSMPANDRPDHLILLIARNSSGENQVEAKILYWFILLLNEVKIWVMLIYWFILIIGSMICVMQHDTTTLKLREPHRVLLVWETAAVGSMPSSAWRQSYWASASTTPTSRRRAFASTSRRTEPMEPEFPGKVFPASLNFLTMESLIRWTKEILGHPSPVQVPVLVFPVLPVFPVQLQPDPPDWLLCCCCPHGSLLCCPDLKPLAAVLAAAEALGLVQLELQLELLRLVQDWLADPVSWRSLTGSRCRGRSCGRWRCWQPCPEARWHLERYEQKLPRGQKFESHLILA